MLTGILLAGGLSTRMGSDKALLMRDQQSMLDYTQQLLTQAGCETVLISRTQNPSDDFIQDIYPELGPLSGIHACVKHSVDRRHMSEGFIVSPVDMPHMQVESLTALVNFGRENQTSCYFEHSVLPCYVHHSSQLLTTLEQRLENTQLSVTGLLRQLNAIPLKTLSEQQLVNTNTPSEWSEALSQL